MQAKAQLPNSLYLECPGEDGVAREMSGEDRINRIHEPFSGDSKLTKIYPAHPIDEQNRRPVRNEVPHDLWTIVNLVGQQLGIEKRLLAKTAKKLPHLLRCCTAHYEQSPFTTTSSIMFSVLSISS